MVQADAEDIGLFISANDLENGEACKQGGQNMKNHVG